MNAVRRRLRAQRVFVSIALSIIELHALTRSDPSTIKTGALRDRCPTMT